jgi:hypothetical protein
MCWRYPRSKIAERWLLQEKKPIFSAEQEKTGFRNKGPRFLVWPEVEGLF